MRKTPRAATARTTRTERVPYRKSRSRRLDTGSGGLLSVIRLRGAPLSRREHVPERPDQLRELEREDELRRRTCPERLERVEVLQHQRLLIDALRGPENGGQRLRVTFCAEDRGLPAPSARRIADCLSPSATVTVAVFLPSASMTTARRLRSADIWRIMASVTFLGGRISRISTFVTLTPHRVVTSSSFVRRTALVSSRFESTSSS